MIDIQKKYSKVRNYSEELCSPLEIEDYVPQPVEFGSPPKWHLAHTTWFFEEFILKSYAEGYKLFHPKFSFLFNSYYNNVGNRTTRANRGDITRPTVKEVFAYRHYVDKQMMKLLDGMEDVHVASLVTLGLNHEQQHQELLITDLKYTLSLNPLFPVYKDRFSLLGDAETASGFSDIRAGIYEIGAGDGDYDFVYDNELQKHKVYLESFSIANKLVTNGEYLEFLEDGGYQNFNLWHDEGFAWVNNNHVDQPLYWHKLDGVWHTYTLGGLLPVDFAAPMAHVNFYEASAYATWKGMRLPTEAEWEVASSKFNWGRRWEWTQSAYTAYPGFKIAAGAIGEYNGKFMVNQKVLRGASMATSEGHSRKTYRNFFHPHLSWQLTGIRLVK